MDQLLKENNEGKMVVKKVTAFVPIKLNNERLSNKNIKSFTNGKPLIHYILNTLKDVPNIDEIYVYCSDETIKDYLPDNIKYLKRSKHLDSSLIDFNEVLTSFANDVVSDIYILAHATAPFINAKSFELGIHMVMNNGYDSAVGVRKIQEFLWMDGKTLNYNLDKIPRTQELPDIYAETCGMYIYEREVLLKQGRRIGEKPYFVELGQIESVDINDGEDFDIANALFQFMNKK